MTVVAGRPAGWSTEAADAVLAPWVDAGVLGDLEVHLVSAVLRLAPDRPDAAVLLALALAARATRLGHVCLDLAAAHDQLVAAQVDAGRASGLGLPDPGAWRALLAGSSVVTDAGAGPPPDGDDPLRPLVLDGDRVYLQRFWSFEVAVAGDVCRRADGSTVVGPTDPGEPAVVRRGLTEVFGGVPLDENGAVDLQFVAAERALTRPLSVIAGGPGTGKTHTVARILAAALQMADERGASLQVALAAPTGKAAARMAEAVEEQVVALDAAGRLGPGVADRMRAITPSTIHSLLQYRTRTSFRHDRTDPLVHDLVVVDETSMVSLPLLARLLDAVRPAARVVLVGDPFQLASIEAGTVMGDLVGPFHEDGSTAAGPLAGAVTELRRGHRFDAGSATAELALAVRDGDVDAVLDRLAAGDPTVHWVRPDDGPGLAALQVLVCGAAGEVVEAALAGAGAAALEAAGRIKVLAAVRRGPLGLDEWTGRIAGTVHGLVPAALAGGRPRVGTPVLVTHNDRVNDLANGDVGVVVHGDGVRWVAMSGPGGLRLLAPARLGEWEPWWAMTIHKSQGSEFAHAVVSLPTVDSPVLTRELLYTAITRAKPEVTVVASEEILRLAVTRPVARASGLGDRLWGTPDGVPGPGVAQSRRRNA